MFASLMSEMRYALAKCTLYQLGLYQLGYDTKPQINLRLAVF